MGVRRRDFMTLIGAAAAWPLPARAQQPAMPLVGYLGGLSPVTFAPRLAAFRKGLAETGYIEGQNVAIEYRWAEGQYDRLPALAADLVRRQVAVIAAMGGDAPALAAKAASTTIPIVFAVAADPVKAGLVSGLNRPGGNLTGVNFLLNMIAAKLFEVLNETVPKATTIGFLVNPSGPEAESAISEVSLASQALGLELFVVKASSENKIDAAFATLAQERVGALLVGKGAKPADLPVQQAVKVELVLNLKTAKTLGLTFPLTLLGGADEVIE